MLFFLKNEKILKKLFILPTSKLFELTSNHAAPKHTEEELPKHLFTLHALSERIQDKKQSFYSVGFVALSRPIFMFQRNDKVVRFTTTSLGKLFPAQNYIVSNNDEFVDKFHRFICSPKSNNCWTRNGFSNTARR